MARYTIELGKAITNGLINWDEVMSSFPDGGDTKWHSDISELIKEHYWMREIGSETPQLFSFYMRRAMNEIMPYYVKLKQAEELNLGVDPLTSFSETETVTETGSDTSENNGTQTSESSGNSKRTDDLASSANSTVNGNTSSNSSDESKSTESGYQKVYAIPMTGGSSGNGPGGFSDDYATGGNVTNNQTTGNTTNTSSGTTESTSNGTTTNTGTQSFENSDNGSVTSSFTQNSNRQNSITRERSGNNSPKFELLSKYRETIINLNLMIVYDKRVEKCFMGVF